MTDITPEFLQTWFGSKKPAFDAYAFPEDVQHTLKELYTLWGLLPPEHKKVKAFWIDGARQVQAACAEYGTSLLQAYHQKWLADPRRHTVASPKSLVNPLTGYAAELRVRGMEPEQPLDSETLSRKKYTSGQFADFIEH